MTDTIEKQLNEYRAQLRQIEANANAVRGAIQAMERLLKEVNDGEQDSDTQRHGGELDEQ